MANQHEHSDRFLSFVRVGLFAAIAGATGMVHAQVDLDPKSAAGGEPPDAVAMMSVGDATTCAALVDGRAKCWGQGGARAVGDDAQPGDAAFLDVGGPVQEIHTNGRQTFALLRSGLVRAWGANDAGQLGLGHRETPTHAPADVELGGVALALAVGDGFACGLLEDAVVRCWGLNDVGQLGLGHTATVGDDETPAASGAVLLDGPAVGLVAGAHHACARLADGTARCWGANDAGQLGRGHTVTLGDDEAPSLGRPIAFEGAVVEPWPGRRSGHIPGSRNVPYADLFDAKTGAMKPLEELRKAFAGAGVDMARPIVTTCGSGVSALVLTLALYRIGVRGTALYDGSWAEWGLPDGPPLATGPA